MAITVPLRETLLEEVARAPKVEARPEPALNSSKPRKRYVPALDGIRFLAVFVVLLKHTGAGASSSFFPLRILGTFAKFGSGVPLFFVVSGFLITSILLDTQDTESRYRNFLARRSLRIFPLYYLYVGAAIVLTGWWTASQMRSPWVFLLYLQNIFLNRADGTNSVLPMFHLWTLGVQEQFYLVWPLLVWRCRTVEKIRALCWAVVAISVLTRIYLVSIGQSHLSDALMPCRAGEMSLGGLFALECFGETWVSRIWPKLLLPVGGFLMISLTVYLHSGPWGELLRQELIVMFSAALLATGLKQGSVGEWVLSRPWLARVGRHYSYGLFIFHPMLLQFCERKLHLGQGTAGGLERVAVTLLGSLLLSVISYEVIERPCLGLKRHFDARRPATREAGLRLVGELAS